MSTKHTPGPWSSASLDQDSNHLEVFAGTTDGEQVAVVKGHDLSTGKYYEAIANARLIAAAPELLEALEETSAALLQYFSGVGSKVDAKTRYELARTAIVKATQL